MITEFDINKFEIQCKGKCSGLDDHFDISRVFEISNFDMAGLACISTNSNDVLPFWQIIWY